MGSRYGGLKQIDSIGPSGETLLDYSVYDALRSGFGKIVFVIRRAIEAEFREVVGTRFEGRVDVRYAFQELDQLPAPFELPATRSKPWGTTHAVLAADREVDGPFAAINADDFYGSGAFAALASHFQSGSPDYAMVGFALGNTLSEHGSVARGVCQVDSEGYLSGIKEHTRIEKQGEGAVSIDGDGEQSPLSADTTVSMNFWGFHPNCFARFDRLFAEFLTEGVKNDKSEFYIPAAIQSLIDSREARVKVLRTNDPWFGVTYREDRPAVVEGVRQLVAAGVYPGALWT